MSNGCRFTRPILELNLSESMRPQPRDVTPRRYVTRHSDKLVKDLRTSRLPRGTRLHILFYGLREVD